MAFNFSRTNDYAIIEDSTSGPILVTRESLPIYSQEGMLYIPSKVNLFHCPFTEIGEIDGLTPTDIGEAVLLLGKTFKGYTSINVTIEG